jgi:hypothetical protein
MIADVVEEWINVADIDGFIVSCKFVYSPLKSSHSTRWPIFALHWDDSLISRTGRGNTYE